MGVVPDNMRPAYRAGYRYSELSYKAGEEGLSRGEEREQQRLYEKMLDGSSTYRELFQQGQAAATADIVWGDREASAQQAERYQVAEANADSKTPGGDGAGGGSRELA